MNAPLNRHPRRLVRGVSAFVALMMVMSNALAVMGLCAAKAPHPAQDARRVMATLASSSAQDEPPCPQHAAVEARNAQQEPATASPHCPQDDPGAQARANDIPPATLLALPVAQRIVVVASPASGDAVIADDQAPPAALYFRLSRLLL